MAIVSVEQHPGPSVSLSGTCVAEVFMGLNYTVEFAYDEINVH